MDFEKTGYLTEDYKYFYIKDKSDRIYDFHYHDFYKIILYVKGDVTYNVEGKSYELKPQDFVLVGRNEIHKPIVNPDVEYERLVVYLSDFFLSTKIDNERTLRECFIKAFDAHINVVHFPAKESIRLQEILQRAIDINNSDSYGKDALSRLYLTEFLIKFNETIEKNGISFNGNIVYNEKIVAVSEYINNNLSNDLSIEYLSERFFISRYHLMRLFKECTGFTIHQYIIEKRLLYVQRLVDDGMKIKDAAVEAGFMDYSMYLRSRKKHDARNNE